MTPKTALSPATRSVAALQDLGPAGPRKPFCRKDDRLVGTFVFSQPRVISVVVLRAWSDPLVCRLRLPHEQDLPEIHPRAERVPLASQDRHAQLVVLLELLPRIRQQAHAVAVDRVALLRPVQRHDENVAFPLDENGCFGHAVSLMRW